MAQCWWLGFVAVISGWIVTESGRQPWIVQGILRTADATSPVIGPAIAVSLALFVVVYGIVFSAGIYFINRLIAKGFEVADTGRSRRGARRRARRRRQEHGGPQMSAEWLLPLIWAGIIGTRGCALCHSRRLRPRHRHAVSVRQGRPRARPDDGVDRAVLGRQRDLAGDGRRGPAGGISDRLCGGDAGDVSAGDRDAAGAGVPRRRLRVPRDRQEQGAVERGLRRRLDARRFRPGHHPRRPGPGHRGQGRRLCRRRFRLGDAVRAALRVRRRRSAMRCSARPGWP